MLVIRNVQLKALAEPVRQQFLSRLAAYVRAEHPAQSVGYDDDALRSQIEAGIQRSASYGITAEVDVARFVLTMFTLGTEFDTDPNLAWARAILDPESGRRPSFRTEQLLEEAIAWAERSSPGSGR